MLSKSKKCSPNNSRFEESGWELKWRRSLPSPVLGIRYADLTGDGLKVSSQ